MYSIFKTGIDGDTAKIKNLRQAERYLPTTSTTRWTIFRKARWTTKLLGEECEGALRGLETGSC